MTTNKPNRSRWPADYPKNQKYNKHKALISLLGILDGLKADRRLNALEVGFLDLWLKSEVKHVDDGDILDLREQVKEILSDGVVEQEEVLDLRQQIDDVLKYSEVMPRNLDDLTNQLLAFLKGITADGKINRDEVLKLSAILNDNEELTTQWPGDIIHHRVQLILEDNVVTDEEAQDLYEMLTGISGQSFLETGVASGMATQYFGDDPSDFDFQGASVCFSGKFLSGPRSFHSREAENLGALVVDRVSQATDCLVLGDAASRDWKFTSHGRKIESVVKNKAKGASTIIMTESCWLQYIDG